MTSYQSRRRDGRTTVRRFARLTACAVLGLTTCLGAGSEFARGASDPGKAAAAKSAVATFLDAVKRGDDAAARGLLTKVARAKTEELGISVAPPVTDTATYTVQDCEIVSETGDLAHVATVWTDVAADGSKSSENVVWVLRLDPEGWRVVGMALRVFDDMPPLLLNFEDPEDMMAKQEMVAAELEKRAGAAADPAAGGPRTARGEGVVPGARK